jgi:hypothetical protein
MTHFPLPLTLMSHDYLFKHLAVGMRILLAVNGDARIPRPHLVNKLLILCLLGVELCELVALPIGGDVKGRRSLLSASEERTSDDGVVIRSVDAGGAKQELAAALEAVEKSTCVVSQRSKERVITYRSSWKT